MLRMRTMPANMSICNSRAERWYNLHQIFTQLQFGLYVMIKLQILSSTKYFQLGICTSWSIMQHVRRSNPSAFVVISHTSGVLLVKFPFTLLFIGSAPPWAFTFVAKPTSIIINKGSKILIFIIESLMCKKI